MIAKKNKQIAQEWFKAFNTQNIDALIALYAEAAEHYSPKLKLREPQTKGFISGKKTLKTWWLDCFERLPSLQYEVLSIIADEQRVFMEYIRHVNGEEALRVGEVLEIKDELIVFSRVFHS
jgi:limonene-1,2-epoxide hydrolase